MLRRVPRALRTAVIVTVLLAAGASIAQSWMSGAPGTAGYVQTRWGPLGPADRDLLTKVRLAGLWEAPTGEQAEVQASRAEVQEVGGHLHVEHDDLDDLVRETADQLGVLLPSRPSTEQLAWMTEMSGLTGTDYDRVFVQRLRAAHGVVLPLIAQVRVGTRNELMREFATTADEYVRRHINYLESTGLVDYAALPEPPSPGLFSDARGPLDLLAPGLVVLAAGLGAFGLFTALRRRPRTRPPGVAMMPTGRRAARLGPDRSSRATAHAIAAIAVDDERPISGPGVTGPHRRIRSHAVPHPRPAQPQGDPALGDPPPGVSDLGDPRISDTGPRHAVRR